MLAVQEGRDDMAKQALGRYNEQLQGAQQLHETWLKHKAETEALKLSLRQLNDKIEEAKRKKNILVARAKRAEAQQRIQETMSGMSDKSAFESFERMAEKIEATRAQGASRRPSSTRRSRATGWPSSSRRSSTRAAPTSSCSSSSRAWACVGAGQGAADPSAQQGRRRRPRRRARGRGRRRVHPLMAVPASGGRRGFPIGRLLLAVASGGPGRPTIDVLLVRVPRRHPGDLPGCRDRSAGAAARHAPAARARARRRGDPRRAGRDGAPHRAAGDRAGPGPAHQSPAVPHQPRRQHHRASSAAFPCSDADATPGAEAQPGLLASALGEILGFLRGAAVPYLKGGVEVLIEGVSVLVMAVYLARTPRSTSDGVVALVPPRRRPLARAILRGPQRRPSGPGWWARSSRWCCWRRSRPWDCGRSACRTSWPSACSPASPPSCRSSACCSRPWCPRCSRSARSA